MAEGGVSPDVVAARGATDGESSEADFDEALLREQYRSLARLGPYIHGAIILSALALLIAVAPTRSPIGAGFLPAALIVVSVLRLRSWFKARAGVEHETLDAVRRKVRAASILGPILTLAFVLVTAILTWQDGVLAFALTLAATWVLAAVSAVCLNMVASEARVIVIAATMPILIAFLVRGTELTLCLAALIAIAACFVTRVLGENFRLFVEIVRSRFIIAEQQRAAEQAREAAMTIALTDDLTGLPNRRCFQALLAAKITTAAKTGKPFALGLIDLDSFKPINDIHGHPAGDEILREVADRLAKTMDGRGSAARIGGDEFAVLCDRVGAHREAIALGEEIQRMFAAPFAVESLSVHLTCACGFALFPLCAGEQGELVRQADAALYRAKASGRASAAELHPRARSAAIEKALPRAVVEPKIGAAFAQIADFATASAAPDRLHA